jgi:putative tryptophan/tyrosine transport system substrate-binding protein
MKRREFIALVGGAFAWPIALKAQQPGKIYRLGLFSAGSRRIAPNPGVSRQILRSSLAPSAVFIGALRDLGWIEGKNIIVEARYAEDQLERLPELAAELVRLNVDVIVTVGTLAPLAAKRATTTIPIVLINAGDPVGSGLVASLAQPGGNITGQSAMVPELGGKRLEIIREVLPDVSRVAVLWNALNPYCALVFRETEAAAQRLSIHVESLEVRGPQDFDRVLRGSIAKHARAIITVEDPLTFGQREQIAEFLLKSGLPGIFGLREYVVSGGLLSYGASQPELFRRAAGYVDKILKGAKPSELPIEQPTKFELIINLKTARALGITIPPVLLARADEVIE